MKPSKLSARLQPPQITKFLLLTALVGLLGCSDDDVMSPVFQPRTASSLSDVVISNLQVATGSVYKIVYGGHVVGAVKYTDRTFKFAQIPTELQGVTYIQTANQDKASLLGSSQLFKFTVDQPVTVYVAHHDGIARPAWLRQYFADTGLDVVNSLWSTTSLERFSVFKRDYQAGTVTLGANADSYTSLGHYTVMVKPSGTTPTAPAAPSGFDAVVRGIRPRGFGATTYSLSQPISGRKAYYVATAGNDANAGTSSAPFRTINKAAQVAIAGDVVMIGNGTYQESVLVRNSGTSSAPIVFQAQNRGGVVLSGGKYTFQPASWFGGKPGTTGQFHVTLKGLIFRDYSDPASTAYGAAAIRPYRGWRIEDCLLDRAGQSGVFVVDDNVTVVKTTIQYSRIHALVAFGKGNGATGPTDSRFVGISGLQLIDVILRGNFTSPTALDGRTSSSVIKMMATKGTVVDNVESYQNNGPGIWFDADNFNYVVRNSYLHDNYSNPGVSPGRGLHLELSWGSALVENNVITNNAAEGVAISNSWGVQMRNNLLAGNRECVRISDWVNRSGSVGQYALKDVTITNNQFKDWIQNACINPYGDRAEGLTGSGGISYSRIVLDYNTYHPVRNANLSGWWRDKGFLNTIDKARSIKTELNGRLGTVTWPL